MSDLIRRPWEHLRELIAADDGNELEKYLEQLAPGAATRAVLRLTPDEQDRLLLTLSPDSAAELIEEIPEGQAAMLIDHLEVEDAASIVDELPSHEQADLLGELDSADAEAILEHMDSQDARELIKFDHDVAGGLMMTEFVDYPPTAKVGGVIDDLAGRPEDYALFNVQYVYVVDRQRRLQGVVRLRNMMFADRNATLSSIMKPAIAVNVLAAMDELESYFHSHEFFAAPVVDDAGRLVGVVRRRAVFDQLAEKAETDHLKSQGIVGGDELRSMPVLSRSGRRLSWLSINIVLNVIAASVIAAYQDTLSAVIALAIFLPIVSDMSGCSGNQAVAVSMRELSLGVSAPADVARVWLKEISVGLLNGAALGGLIAATVWVWQGSLALGLVVGLALALNTVVAVSIGGTVPLILKGLRVDPALASGPVLTTITDMCGFFFVLSFASLALPYLAA